MGIIEGRRGTGRKQPTWLRNIPEWTGIISAEQQDKTSIATVIVNVRETHWTKHSKEEDISLASGKNASGYCSTLN